MLNTKFDLYKTEWLDLVFADRNKNYGAYDLRVHYGDNLMKALAITLVGFTVAAISLTIAFKHDPGIQIIEHKQVVPILQPTIIPEPEKVVEAVKRKTPVKAEVPKPIAPTQVNVNTQRFVPPVITTEPVITEPPVLDPGKQIASVDHTADATKPITGSLDGTNTPGSNGGAPGSQAVALDGTTYDAGGVDVMPEPFGGSAAWTKFLQKNLRYPETDQEGRVTITFIVEKDGHLTDFKLVKGVASELDREAMRVLKLAPAWKPGMQNGHAVRVRYTIPIVFTINQ